MNTTLRKFIPLLLVLIVSCSNKPNNLQECYYELDNKFTITDKENIRKSNTTEIMIDYHMDIGMFIRNEWIRHGNSSLLKEINYKNWNVSIDDISGVILDGYWHYLQNKNYDWSKRLQNADIYSKSYEIPNINDNPDKATIDKLNFLYDYSENNITYIVHLFKATHTNHYYIYIFSKGWRKIDNITYHNLYNVKTRNNLIKLIYKK